MAKAYAEKTITKNGECYVTLIDAALLDSCHWLEHERIHLLLISDTQRALVNRAEGLKRPVDLAQAYLPRH